MPYIKSLILGAALAVAASTTVLAAEATGTIQSINKARDMIRLSDGTSFRLPEGIEAESLHVGERVKVAYSIGKHKVHQVSAITPIQ